MSKHNCILKKKGTNKYYCSMNNSEFTSDIDKADRFTQKQAERNIHNCKNTTMYAPIALHGELEIKKIKTIIVK